MAIETPSPEGFELSPDGTHAVFRKAIEISPNDERSYRLLRLMNDLEVLVIHDPKADKSAACLDVHVGHLSDPASDNLQGLAHFLEHLLFLGTEKYPRENEYKEFLSLHAGKSNASTWLDNTEFHFEVGHAHLEGALDRQVRASITSPSLQFAQFFISPAFNVSCKEREIHAVDSEFKRNLQLDSRRIYQIAKHLSSRDHPYWHFGTGNLLTLQEGPKEEGIDSRNELIKFYHKYYSANIMKLVILGREPLDVLAGWAVQKFSEVRNLGVAPPAYPSPPLTSKELLTTVYIKPVRDTRSLEIKFLIPGTTPYYTVQPTSYITHLIGHEGSGSILSLLKRKGWANGLSAGCSSGGIGHEFLKITIDLTSEGLLHHEDITIIVFQYIQMLRDEGVKDYILDEEESLASIAFRFKEMQPAAEYVTKIAREMQQGYAPEWILSGSMLIRARNTDLVMNYINKLTVDRWRGQVVCQDVSKVPGGAFTETERWYGTPYHVDSVSPELLKRLQQIGRNPELHLPPPNEYIPKDFETGKVDTPNPQMSPVLVQHTPLTRIWHKKDDVFWVPKVHLYFRLVSPIATLSPNHLVKSILYMKLVQDVLNEDSYSAALAGLSYSLTSNMEGIILKVEGYNDKALLLLQKVVQTMKTLQVDNERFYRIKDDVERQHRNHSLNNPNILAIYYEKYLNSEKQWTFAERLEELQGITPEDLQRFIPQLLDHLHIEGLVHGNMSISQAVEAGNIVEKGLAPRALSPFELISMRSIILPEGCRAVYQRDVIDPSNLNSGIDYYIQTGFGADKTDRAFVQLMAQIIQEPCFNQLRTIEQLGYIVLSGVRQIGGTLGVVIVVQSERDPIHVENRIENFLRVRIANMLESMTEEAYQKQVQSLIQKKLEKHKNLKQETTRYWDQITSGFYNFEEVQEDVQELEKITLGTIRIFFSKLISPDVAQSKKLSVHFRSLRLPPNGSGKEGDELVLKDGTVIIKDVDLFKANSKLSAALHPTLDFLRTPKL
ncbi:Insulinase (Peptidase M16) [Entomortierella chlamydospora]|uniref:Insulinase (Peptidase M16) n=1 Tax=Entomortierella chlamydospora TaxID=101097 RepID=A0A9P6T0N5_9FUNG|nr:Insulinase (Peptidase M16) [Entomortierella chlamydospora]